MSTLEGVKCFVCEQGIKDDKRSCNQCSAVFHEKCLAVNDNFEVWTCPICQAGVLKVPTAPKSIRARSHVSKVSSKGVSSKRSSIAAEELLRALEEEKDMMDKHHKEQEQLLLKKQEKEQEFIQRKQRILQDTLVEISSQSSSKKSVNISPKQPPLSARQKVKDWVDSNAAHSTRIEISDMANDVGEPHPRVEPPLLDPIVQPMVPQNTASYKNPTPPSRQGHLEHSIAVNPADNNQPLNSSQQLGLNTAGRASSGQQATLVNQQQLSALQPQSHRPQNPFYPQEAFVIPPMPAAQPPAAKMYLSESRIKEDSMKLTTLTKEQIAARQVTKDLPKFSGEPKEWPKFLSSFQRSTALCGFNNSENLERLSRSLKGDALAAVGSSLSLDDNLPRVMEILEMLFGKPEYIINSLIDEMRQSRKPIIDSIDTIISYSLEVENISTTMRLAKLSEHLWNPILLTEMINRLPTALKLEWAQSSFNSTVNIEVFNAWLKQKSMMYSSVLKKPPILSKPISSKAQERGKGYLNIHGTSETQCHICDSTCKTVEDCEEFKNMDYNDRWEEIKKNRLCRTCLKKHWGRCKRSQPCGEKGCKSLHHKMLHNSEKDDIEEVRNEQVNTHATLKPECQFKVLPIVLKNGNNFINTYAMLDDCSSLTLVSRHIVDQLKASGLKQDLCLCWTSNVKRIEKNSQKLSLEISGLDSQAQYTIRCRSVENLNLPKQTLNYETYAKDYKYMGGLPIRSFHNAEVGLLIGIDNANLLLTRGYRTGEINEPIAAHTKLGWIIFGSTVDSNGGVFHVHECDCVKSEEKLEELLKENYDIESLGVNSRSDPIIPSEDQRALDIWSKTLKFENNRYEIGLLFRYDNFTLPNNWSMAKRRLNCLLKKCEKEPELQKIIGEQINSYVEKGYARIVSEEELKSLRHKWYLPIFIVRNPNKPNKIRLVWDGAATQGETSLNSVLLKGPDLLSALFGILLRFRQHRIAICGDIQEMFHQVHIRREDQKYQLFLWVNDEGNIVTFAMVGMTFGASCSPSSAQYVKNYNAKRFKNSKPRAVESIVRNHYVDDLLESVETENEAIQLAKDVHQIHQSASFNIRNWISNSTTVSQALNSSQEGKNLQMFSETPMEKVLGMWWQTKTDQFTYSLRYQKTNEEVWKGLKTPTKREVLKAVMSIYDPLGLLSHVLIYPRILLQSIWKESCTWDQEISTESAELWLQWTKVLPQIENIKVPRWFGYKNGVETPELHVFTDASKEAYAAVAYLRFKDPENSNVRIALVTAKSRVAPLKYMSVPRLELMGAVIGARLAQTICENLTIAVERKIFWSDSTCVLGWINSNHRKYRPYVAARIGEILETTSCSEWRYVPTSLNIADEATRMKLVDMSSNSCWFTGPPFLHEDECNWPTPYRHILPEQEEMLSQYVATVNIHHAEIVVENITGWIRLRRIQAMVYRFITNLKRSVKGEKRLISLLMSSKELKMAESTLFRQAQEEGYPEEIAALEQSSQVPKSSPVFNDSPYLDDFGVMRAQGRIDSISGVPFSTKRPVLLPKNHRITVIIMNYYHRMYHHENSETVVNELRQKFVIPSLRVQLKSIKKNCQWCKNKNAAPGIVMMSGLPEARLATFCKAFSCIGIDYFGPMFVEVQNSQEKRWGILITCLTTRAVHLEIAHSLSTNSCILGLRRFMSRRGIPRLIYSDNATNFKASSKVLRRAIKKNIDSTQLAIHFTSPETEWSFIPPASPHMGGAWERMVRSVKSTMNSIFPLRYNPNDEMLLSVLVEAENIINSRPLSYVPLENDLDEALTPNHFILGSSNGLKPLGKFPDGGDDMRDSWQQSQFYSDQIWRKWIKTILPELRRRGKWFRDEKPIKINDIVLVIDERSPRNSYKRAKVIGLNEGSDGKVRSVSIQCEDNVYVRPITKLAVLDVYRENEKLTRSIPSCDQGILGGSVEKPGEQQNHNENNTSTNNETTQNEPTQNEAEENDHSSQLQTKRILRPLPHRQ